MLTRNPFAAAVAALSFVVLTHPTAVSADLQPSHLPAGAKWVIHVNYEELKESELYQTLRQRNEALADFGREWIRQQYGIDLPEDLRSVTMFSDDYQAYTGTVLLQTDYDASTLEAALRKGKDHQKTDSQGVTFHTVRVEKPTDPWAQRPGRAPSQGSAETRQGPNRGGDGGNDDRVTVTMVDDDTIVLSGTLDAAQKAVALIKGDSESLAGTDSPLLQGIPDGAWMIGAAVDLGELADHPVAMPVLAQHERIHWSFGEREGKLYEQADFVARSEDVADKMRRVLQGAVAYETLWAEGSQPMMEVMKSVKVRHEGNTTGFDWEGETQTAISAMEDVLNRLATWKAMAMSKPQPMQNR